MKARRLANLAAGLLLLAAAGVALPAHAILMCEVDFTGSVGQAPPGNPFGVAVGAIVSGVALYPDRAGCPGARELGDRQAAHGSTLATPCAEGLMAISSECEPNHGTIHSL